ncbi:ATP-binding cassette domain-containing protein, partial [Agrobacterium tumefaciens]|uniref:ATP-binding cassette domain-containing protein n=1 Tax=Agrobacterium tumefaciens TaxID=358 RepID=UPI003BA019BC
LPAVDDVSFTLERGRILGLVGESGSGKSVTGFSIMGLVDAPGRIVGGEILFQGRELVGMKPREMRTLQGNRIAMIFQEPTTALNPTFTIGAQLRAVYRSHRGRDAAAAQARARYLLDKVGITDGARRLEQYPHELSGGMRQRVLIAMALMCAPDL